MFITLSLRMFRINFLALDADITQLFTDLVILGMESGFQIRCTWVLQQQSILTEPKPM
jgi:hypothetical protein